MLRLPVFIGVAVCGCVIAIGAAQKDTPAPELYRSLPLSVHRPDRSTDGGATIGAVNLTVIGREHVAKLMLRKDPNSDW